MKLMLRAEDRIDRENWTRPDRFDDALPQDIGSRDIERRDFGPQGDGCQPDRTRNGGPDETGGRGIEGDAVGQLALQNPPPVTGGRAAPASQGGNGALIVPLRLDAGATKGELWSPGAWRVPGFTRPEPLTRADWLIRGFTLLARGGVQALTFTALCRCPGGSRQGFEAYFQDLAEFRTAMLGLWERTALSISAEREDDVAGDIPARLLCLARKAAEADQPGAVGTGLPSATVLERAMRDWARSDPGASAVLARVERCRLATVQALLEKAGLSPQRAGERAAIFYAACLGFDLLRESAAVVAEAPLRSLALAILGARGSQAAPAPLRPPSKGDAPRVA